MTQGDRSEDEGGGEVERLRHDLAEAREQQVATSEVLAAVGRSGSDLEVVLETVVRTARRLCRADAAQVYLLDNGAFRLAAASGVSQDYRDYLASHPMFADRATLSGRVALDRKAQQVADVLADPEYGRPDVQRVGGFRTTLGIPMLVDDDPVGVLTLWRTEVSPFSDRAIDLGTTFAAHAAIAIRNAHLVGALQARTAELRGHVEQLEALREVGETVSSTLDLDEVLTTIVTRAVQLTGADGGSIMEFDDEAQEFRVRAAFGSSGRLLEALRQTSIRLSETLVGRAARDRRPEQVDDLDETTAAGDAHLQRLYEDGWRSLVAVPMLRDERIVGAFVVRRRQPGTFSPETCDLLELFANQSALAVLHARLFRELETKSAELEVAGRHKSEFLASMSHELRTPLNAVIGFSEVLLERMFGEINDRQEEYLNDIWNSGRHLLELLNEILDLSKVEAGHMELERSVFVLRDMLDHCVAMVRERAARHGVALSLEVDPDLGSVEADELRVKQVVVNLLSNAVKFTPAGGTVMVGAVPDGDEVTVTVTDTGIGVPVEDRERIFESFQQGSRRAPTAEGTGLGLTLSKRIVELHDGRMWLESEVGVGSTFSFSIPGRVAQSAWTETGDIAAGEAQTTGEGVPQVVVIDDDRRSVDLVTVYLEGTGLGVAGASDGERGLELVRDVRPAAIVLDIRLPGIDGWALLKLLAADPETADTPVIVVSMVDERTRGLALGADEYLVKPVRRDELLAALTRCHVPVVGPTTQEAS